MSRPSSVSPRQAGGRSGTPTPAGPAAGPARRKKLKESALMRRVEIAVNLAWSASDTGEEKEMEFPSSFTSTERAFVHRLCQSLGLISKSKGWESVFLGS
uniref:Uncharacterized protein n=1 Tax=Melopsittacus undulatus TaxID=13146 RepID=A0A8V5GJB9_MELUD